MDVFCEGNSEQCFFSEIEVRREKPPRYQGECHLADLSFGGLIMLRNRGHQPITIIYVQWRMHNSIIMLALFFTAVPQQ